ncbi:MAG: tripartite tricarboxylate transporter substrate binding protein, partial [Sulfuricaulis sp.]|nr:tripartite tricarboxylate transporter substrate binding protein [Sulfuricaulis sp.]
MKVRTPAVFLLKTLPLFIVACAALAQAQTYPGKPVRLVVPFPAGGPADAIARMFGEKLAAMWNQPVVVENRGGAGGNIGAELVAKSAPNGYTLLINASSHVINASIYSKLPYDPIKDFTPVTEVASYMLVLVVHPSLPARSVKEFVALAKSKPGQLIVANAGRGTPTHLTAELFKIAARVDFVNVPYKGAAPANVDLIGGQALAMFNNPINALPQVAAGRLRALAVTGAKHLAIAPELPTIAESGYPGFEAGTWYGIFGPANLPADIATKLHEDFVTVLRMRDIQEKLAAQG